MFPVVGGGVGVDAEAGGFRIQNQINSISFLSKSD